jgi:sec-independent protein translocase protein TatC
MSRKERKERKAQATAAAAAPTGHMTLIEHLVELRVRLMRSVLAVLVGMIIAFLLYDHVLHFLTGPYRDLCASKKNLCPLTGGKALNIDPIGGFGTRLKVSGYLGIVLALPVLLWQLWRFIAPGLVAKEKKYAIPFILSSLTLFGTGALVAWLTFPKALEWLTAYAGDSTQPAFVIEKYVSFAVLLMVGFGVGFQFPVILVTLELMGVVTPQWLAKNRRVAILTITIIAAVVTPGGDPFSMLGLALPLLVFFEVSVLIGRIAQGSKRRKAAKAALG